MSYLNHDEKRFLSTREKEGKVIYSDEGPTPTEPGAHMSRHPTEHINNIP